MRSFAMKNEVPAMSATTLPDLREEEHNAEPKIVWREEEHRPEPNEAEIWKALYVLCKACDLRGESGTDHLLHVLLEACKRVKRQDYNRVVKRSYRDGLGFDVTYLIIDRIVEVMKEWDIVQSWCVRVE
jgi:hypothetical protein